MFAMQQDVKLLCSHSQPKQAIVTQEKTAYITHYDRTAVDLAKQIQKMMKKKNCGFGACQMAYQVPCDLIDKIVFADNFKKENDLPDVDNSIKEENDN